MTATNEKGQISAATPLALASNPEELTNRKEVPQVCPMNEPASKTHLEVPCARDHCDAQGGVHLQELAMYSDEVEARKLVSHSIDLGGVFGVDCIGDGPWTFWTNHNEIFESEIEWWIAQANAAASLCTDLNKKASR